MYKCPLVGTTHHQPLLTQEVRESGSSIKVAKNGAVSLFSQDLTASKQRGRVKHTTLSEQRTRVNI